ncbi:ELWxxDGT repeat protein [Aquimarina sp. MMG016]|uniref:ELWxxDGT repeat protein n=1 Tax=Aquimarina sp. MMG016 TaxID=2822690 RepID=UPI001B3A3B9E|nr:ELWxxDGT repeat protein [Aquimarina sp. MMG016]MBQ4819022.1 T9SS type A sorting domain-containing protein [Aquimarina sp. MMG016]
MRQIFTLFLFLLSYSFFAQHAALVKDINQSFTGYAYVEYITEYNGKLYFLADDRIHGEELWVSDGTTAGTHLLADIRTGSYSSNPKDFVELNGKLYFSARGAHIGAELWETDGTPEGTKLVADINPQPGNGGVGNLTVFNNKLYFGANDGVNGVELWTSDGTEAGTTMVKDIYPGSSNSYPNDFKIYNNKLYFEANDGVYGDELWVSDGTEAGTQLVKDIYPGSRGTRVADIEVYNGKLYFQADNGIHGSELWVSDGTEAGTQLFKDIQVGAYGSNTRHLYVFNGKLYFQASESINGNELWVSDGTVSGTTLFYDIRTGGSGSRPQNFSTYNNKMYFAADDGIHGNELWETDGTIAGTKLAVDIDPGPDRSNPIDLVVFDNKLFFSAEDENAGLELFSTDGTESGTQQISYIDQRTGNSSMKDPVAFNNKLLFGARDGINGNELWISDGTEAGTQMLKDIRAGSNASGPSNLTLFNNKVYFDADDGIHGNELWETDGTTAGTKLAVDVVDGSNYSNPNHLTVLQGMLYFTIYNNATGSQELFKTDGTKAGTQMIDVFKLTSGVANIYEIVVVNNKLYLAAATPNDGTEVWETDGTEAGSNIAFETGVGTASGYPRHLTSYNGELYYFSYDPTTTGGELWAFDPATDTNRLIKDINPGTNGSTPEDLYVFNGKIYFSADDGIHGRELWSSDGTEAGTQLVANIHQGNFSSYPGYFGALNNRLYFRANDGIHGDELWETDGTQAGTRIAADINPRQNSGSSVDFLTALNNRLYFRAKDAIHSDELYVFIPYDCNSLPSNKLFVSETGTDSANGTSWSESTTLKQALKIAQSCPAVEEIWVQQGTYVPGKNSSDTFHIPDNIKIYGGFNGTETMLSERDWVNNTTILSGDIGIPGDDAGNSETIINIENRENILLNGFVIEGGNATIETNINRTTDTNGGAIYMSDSNNLVITNCIFRNNQAQLGAVIYSEGTSGNTSFINCLFYDNIATVENPFQTGTQNLLFTNSTVVNNTAASGFGIFGASTGNISLTNSIVDGSHSLNFNTTSTGSLTATYSYVKGENPFGTGNIDGTTVTDVLFKDGANKDFYLQATSPLIDQGNNTANTEVKGLGGNDRIIDGDLNTTATIDIGAFEYDRLDQNITFDPLANVTYGDPTFDLNATASSGLTITYSSSDTNVATISGNTVTIIGVGTTTITASQSGNLEYKPATDVSQTLTVLPRAITVTADAGQNKVFGDADPVLTYSITSGSLVSGDVLNGNLERTTGEDAGLYAINQGTLANANYEISYVGDNFEIIKANQTITFNSLNDVVYSDADFNLNATSSAGLDIDYSSSDSSVATVSGNTVTIVGMGTTTITASQSGNGNYNAATSVSQTLIVLPRAITVTADAGQNKVFGDLDPVFTYSITSGSLVNGDVLNGNLERIAGEDVGTYPINQGTLANAKYDITYIGDEFEIIKADQIITFNSLSDVTYGDADFNLNATADSGLAVAYSSSDTSVVTITGNTITIVGVGATTITASQSGNENYNTATSVQQTLTVIPRAITITADAGQSKVFGDIDPVFTYSITSGSIVNGDVLNGNLERTSGENAGLYPINQGTLDNPNYQISYVDDNFEITPADQNITFGSLADVTYGDPTFNLNATASSGLAVAYNSSDTSVATVSGNTITIVGVGATTITASQSGNENYNTATSVKQTLTVIPRAIKITADADQSKVFGDLDPVFTYSITSGSLVGGDVLNGNLERISGEDAGTYPINQGTLNNPNYNIAFVSNDFEITKATQVLTFDPLADVTYGDPDFNLNATASSGLAVTFSSANTNVATVSGNTITIVGAGTTNIVVIQEGNQNYEAVNVSQTLTVLQKNITITADAGQSKVFGTVDPELSYSFTNGNLLSNDLLTGSLERAVGEDVGIYPINLGTLANLNYNITFESNTLEITTAGQVITFDSLANVRFGDPTFELKATASSGLDITYTSSNPEVVTISGNIATIVGEGVVIISAHQPGNKNYSAATSVTNTLTVLPGEIQEELIKLYPNPVVNEIQISETPSKNRLSIYDGNGSLVKQLFDYSKNDIINVAELPSGMYMIEIIFFDYRGKTLVKKFIKE